MSEKEFREICELDNIAEEAGGFVDSNVSSASEVHYDYRSIISYCKETLNLLICLSERGRDLLLLDKN